MSVQYITVSRVKEAMRSSYDSSDDAVLGDILLSCCAFLDNFTNRANGGFASQTYDELYHGTGRNILFLRNKPVQSIARLACTELPAISIKNNDTDMGCRASVQVIGTEGNPINVNSQYTSTGIELTYIKGGVNSNQPVTNTLLWANYPTVTSLAAAINAAGNNWTAQVQGGFGNWLSSDLRATQGAFGARIATCYLWIHWYELPWFRINENTAEIYSPQGFHRGHFNWRVQYTAGYSTFPDDLTQALAELTADTYYAREANANMQNENLDGYSYSRLAGQTFEGLSNMSRQTILRYRLHSVPKFSSAGW